MSKPYNAGISEFKRLLKQNPNLTKSEKNRAVLAYKKRVKERMTEILKDFNERVDNGAKV